MKKILPWMIMVLVSITLIISATFVLYTYLSKDNDDKKTEQQQAVDSVNSVRPKQLSAEEIVEVTSKIEDITTNLANKDQIRLSFAFQLENKKAKAEFEKLQFIVQSEIINLLADTQPTEIQGSKGLDNFSAKLMNRVNAIMMKGKVQHIYITNIILI